MVEDKRKMEQRYSLLEDELEDEQSNLELMVEKVRKNAAMVEQLTMDLSVERSATQKLENGRMLLERQSKEQKAKISELETLMKTRSKAMIASLETKINNLEEQVEIETKLLFLYYKFIKYDII